MVRTAETRRLAALLGNHQRPSVSAAVVQYPDLVVVLADNDQRTTRDLGPKERPGSGNLAFMAHITPGPRKNTFTLKRKDGRIGIDAPVDPMGFNQSINLGP